MKNILLLGLLSMAAPAMAAKQLKCEAISITNSSAGITDANYHPKAITINLDKNGEGETEIDAQSKTSVSLTEDNFLKGLFSVLLTRGDGPTFQPDGLVLSALLKKDQMVTKDDLDDLLISTITLKKGEKAQAFSLLNSANLTGVSVLALTNKLAKALREANLQLVGNDRIFFERQMMIQSAMNLLSQEKVKKILADKFTEGEVIMMGLNLLCIETP